MGFFKILGGAAIGVAAVAAAPFTGGGSVLAAATLAASLSGAGTIAAAAAAGAAGAAIANNSGKKAQKAKDKGYSQGKRETTAKYTVKTKKLLKALEEIEKKFRETKDYYDFLVAAFAIGLATANADGEISEEEQQDIDEFIFGISHIALPSHIKEILTKLKNRPPNFSTAMEYVRKLKHIDLGVFELIIQVIAESDGKVVAEERAVLEAFRKAAA